MHTPLRSVVVAATSFIFTLFAIVQATLIVSPGGTAPLA